MSAPQWRVPPLRFERALLEEGPLDTLPAPARGSKRVLGQTLSPSARRVFDDARERFVEQASISRGAGGAAPQWASVLSKLPSAVDEAALLHALRLHLRLPQANTAGVPLPSDAPVHTGVEVFTIGESDQRQALRGQRGVRAVTALRAGEVIGCLRAHTLTRSEWLELKLGVGDGASAARLAALGPVAALEQELAVEAFCHEFSDFNALHAAQLAADGLPPPQPLFASAFGVANAVSLVNDGRATRGAAARPNNCELVEVLVRNWPVLILVTVAALSPGDELLMRYGQHYWNDMDDLSSRLACVQRAAAGLWWCPLRRNAEEEDAEEAAVCAITTAAEEASRSASCGEHMDAMDDMDDWCAPQLSWRPFGSCQLSKRSCSVPASEICPLIAHAAAPELLPPPWVLRSELWLSKLTTGPDFAAQLTAMLPAWERVPLLVEPAPGADAAARARFAHLVARLGALGKAARCEAATACGRAAFLLPLGAFAEERMAPAVCPADDVPRLFVFVLAPACGTLPPPAVASADAAPALGGSDDAHPAAPSPLRLSAPPGRARPFFAKRCRVLTCNAPLRTPRDVRLRLCAEHACADMLLDGVYKRLCGGCKCVHPLEAFEGSLRTCTRHLLRLRARRQASAACKRRPQAAHAATVATAAAAWPASASGHATGAEDAAGADSDGMPSSPSASPPESASDA